MYVLLLLLLLLLSSASDSDFLDCKRYFIGLDITVIHFDQFWTC